ncbi:MAG: MarR family winged helix-turn-helix transcriptional regulator [Pseudomonadales bacterium]
MNNTVIANDEKSSSASVWESESDGYHLHDNIGFLLRTTNQYAISRFNSYMKNVMLTNNVTTTQFAVITTVFRFPKISFSELSAYTYVDQPTLNGLVKRLVNRGLLVSVVNEDDKRSRQISLTQKGNRLAQDLVEHGNKIGEFTAANLTEKEARTLGRLLNKLRGCGGLPPSSSPD